ncbi:MAG TPA: outer membrane protein assembly factor BamE [Methylomirabilota bacterium]|nr:outer membrane protein assembly factor BamE [Methylomirabilota bacterium]
MTAFNSIEVWLVALAITICVIGGFSVFARWCGLGPAIPRNRLDRLRVGMTSTEIVALIGQPREVRHTPEGHRQWIYGSRMKRHVLMMEFDSHDRLQIFAHGVPGAHRRTIPGEHT